VGKLKSGDILERISLPIQLDRRRVKKVVLVTWCTVDFPSDSEAVLQKADEWFFEINGNIPAKAAIRRGLASFQYAPRIASQNAKPLVLVIREPFLGSPLL